MSRMTITAAVTAVGVSLFAGAADAETIPERLMTDLARDFRLQDFQAAGIAGNLARETGNFRFMQELEPIVEGSRGGIGYSQWTASRRLSFEDYAGSLQRQMTYEVNYGYLKEELNGRYSQVVDDVRGSKNLWEATVIFMRGYLKPKRNPDNIRISMNYGNAYLRGDFSGSGCQSHHNVTIDGRRMMIAVCPETTIRVAARDVGVVLASSERPRARPAEAGWTRVADAGLGSSSRPRARPDRDDTGQPGFDAVAGAILVAMSSEAVQEFMEAPVGEHRDAPIDPPLHWDPVYARKEDDPADHLIEPEEEASFSMFS